MRDREKVAEKYDIDITDLEMKPFLDTLIDILNLIDTLTEKKNWEGLRLLQNLISEVFTEDLETDEKTTQDLNKIHSFVCTACEKNQSVTHDRNIKH